MTAMMPRPRPARFDFAGALARLQDDRTDALREKYPELGWVWDELDDLRSDADETVSADEFSDMEDKCENWMHRAERAREDIDRLVSDFDMSETVQAELDRISVWLDGD